MTPKTEKSCELPSATDQPSSVKYSRLTTQLANERTFLAWIRTGIALLAFGFVVEKAGPIIESLGADIYAKQHNFVRYSGIAGVVLMLSGAFVIAISTVRFWLIDRSIRRGACETSVFLDIIIAAGITLITVVFILFLVFQSSIMNQ